MGAGQVCMDKGKVLSSVNPVVKRSRSNLVHQEDVVDDAYKDSGTSEGPELQSFLFTDNQINPKSTEDHEDREYLFGEEPLEQDVICAPPRVVSAKPGKPLSTASSGLGSFEVTNIAESIRNMSLNSSACQVEIQKPAPSFKGQAVVNGEFKEISLDDYKGKYVVLFFYPLDFTFVCPTEIIAFSDRAEEFRDIGCELIACSNDSHYSHFAWVTTSRKNGGLGNMNIPLLADKNGSISRKYGVYKEDEGISFRGLFIIDGNQNLRQITINDLPVGRSVDETLRLVQAFQFTDKHGEVCPAGWKPGGKTIKPSVTESKAYFENAA